MKVVGVIFGGRCQTNLVVFARKIFGNFCRVKKDILELRKIGRPDPGSGPMSSTIVTTIMTTSVPDDGDGGDGGDDGDDAAVGRWTILMMNIMML